MKRITSVVIVGGGSSGWMSAAYLRAVLFDLKITLIESAHVPRIGVGEATTPALNRFMSRLGVPEYGSWLKQVDGTIKTGILFKDWAFRGDTYWHPFENLDYLDRRYHVGHYWLQKHQTGAAPYRERDSFYDNFFLTTQLNAREHRGPVIPTHAYNFDTDKFGSFLRTRSDGVEHILDDVTGVNLDEHGDITSVSTLGHGEIRGDLYIDCTGFRRTLIRAVAPDQKFESYKQSLFCDRAVVFRVPYASEQEKEKQLHPYVQSRALSNGWAWSIPLNSRLSSGYVYSSAFATATEAEAELRSYLGEDRTRGLEAFHLKFESGKLEKLWVANCVAVGLSGSFVEPLESTGLAITQVGLEILGSILDARYYENAMRQRYNMHMQKFCDDIRQFIIAHYCFTSREDTPFWRAVKHDTFIPPDLQARLDVFQQYLPSSSSKGLDEWWFFGDASWFSVLLGMNFKFEKVAVPEMLHLAAERIRQERLALRDKLKRSSVSHIEFLRRNVYFDAKIPRMPFVENSQGSSFNGSLGSKLIGP